MFPTSLNIAYISVDKRKVQESSRPLASSALEKSIGTACHISLFSPHPLLISLSRTFTSPAGSPGMADARLMSPGSHLLTACFLDGLADIDLIRTPQGEKAGVRRPSFPLSFRLRPYNKPAPDVP